MGNRCYGVAVDRTAVFCNRSCSCRVMLMRNVVVVEVAGSVVVLVFVVVDVVLVVVVFAAVVVVGFTEVVVGVVDVELSDLIVMFLLRSKALRSRSGSTALVFKT